MINKALQIGAIIKGKYGKYYIDEVFDRGGSCYVYKAHYVSIEGSDTQEGKSNIVLIKECFPYSIKDKAIRVGNTLYWNISDERKNGYINKFKDACSKINEMYYSKLANNTSYLQEMIDENNTVYSVVPINLAGTAYCNYEDDKCVGDILETIKALAYVIKKYHEKYLHLDLKPSNFLLSIDASKHKIISLFDLDSIVEVDANKNPVNTNIDSISIGYCPLELISFNIANETDRKYYLKDIGPWTDIYSIGVILYQGITGYIPNYDSSNGWEDSFYLLSKIEYKESDAWKDENGYSLNPVVKYKVTHILEKCLSDDIDERYKRTEELIEDLEDVIPLCKASYIQNIDNSIYNFTGRTNEIEIIGKHFFDNKPGIVILHGDGGIGKSTLAREYWKLHEKEYSSGIWLDYKNGNSRDGNINELLESSKLTIKNFTPQKNKDEKKEHLEECNRLLKAKGTFVVLDNFDVPESDFERYRTIIEELQRNSLADILITTRSNFEYLPIGEKKRNVKEVQLNELEFEESYSLFLTETSDKLRINEFSYRKLFYYVKGNTYVLHILAKLPIADKKYKSVDDILKKLESYDSLGKVGIPLDQKISADEAIAKTWNIYRLNDDKNQLKNTLLTIHLFRRTIFDEEMIDRLFPNNRDEFVNNLNDLIGYGWVKESNVSDSYYLHPMVNRLIERDEQLRPDISKEPFSKYKEWEFYMFFTYDYLHWHDGTSSEYKHLESHFEEGDKIPSLIIPPDLYVEEKEIILGNPLKTIIREQICGRVGSEISVSSDNPHYESESNCIFERKDGSVALVLMSIKESRIPNCITVIMPNALCNNQNNLVIVPKSVDYIFLQDYGSKKEFDICTYDDKDRINKSVFENPVWIFESLPRKIDVPCTVKTVLFNSESVTIENNFAINKKTNKMIIFGGSSNRTITIPDRITEVKLSSLDRVPHHYKERYIPYVLELHKNVKIIGNRMITTVRDYRYPIGQFFKYFTKITMPEDGEKYKVIDDCLIYFDDQDRGIVVYSWGELSAPRRCNISALGNYSQESVNSKSRIIVPKNIEFIDALAFRFCHVKTIIYEGTIEEWNRIEKAGNWHGTHNDVNYVVCSNGKMKI